MESYSHLCRLCLASDNVGFVLFEEGNSNKHSKELEEVFQIQLQNIPGWPAAACNSCIKRLREVIEFKATIKSSQESLLKLISNVRIQCVSVEFDDIIEYTELGPDGIRIDSEIQSEETIKEEIFPDDDKETDERAPISEDASEVDSDDEDCEWPGTDQIRVDKKCTPIDYTLEEMLRDLKLLQCAACKMKFASSIHLNAHLGRVHKKYPGSITCCGMTFRSRSEWYEHMRYHLNKDAFACEECGKRWLSSRQMKIHQKAVHSTLKFDCQKCGKTFKSLMIRNRHLKRHDGPRASFKCPQCDKDFTTPFNLKVHLVRVHENPEACDICGWTGVRVDDHKRRSHPTRDQLTKCGVCKKRLPTISMRDHMRRNHGELFLCPTCGATFRTRENLKMHTNRDHLGVRFDCEHCSQKHTTRGNLKKHYQAKHPGMPFPISSATD